MPILLALLVLAVAEIWLIIVVGGAIGAGWTVLLLIAGSLIGGWLLRREGAKTFRALRDALNERRAPHREVADGGLVFIGGVLMLLPGLISDGLGLLCLLPPTRAVVHRVLFAQAARRLPGPVRVSAHRAATSRGGHPVIDGEIVPPPA